METEALTESEKAVKELKKYFRELLGDSKKE